MAGRFLSYRMGRGRESSERELDSEILAYREVSGEFQRRVIPLVGRTPSSFRKWAQVLHERMGLKEGTVYHKLSTLIGNEHLSLIHI